MSTKNDCGQHTLTYLVIAAALTLSGCSSNPSAWGDQQEVQEPVEQVTEAVTQPLETSPAEELAVAPFAATEAAPQVAHDIKIRPDYPREYVVKKGDTLWGIASRFLEDPWYWPEIWYRNPQLDNPHLIYPGDMLSLTYINGRPSVQVTREVVETGVETGVETVPAAEERVVRTDTGTSTKDGRKVVRLSPSIHRSDRSIAIPSIPSDAIKQFLTNPRVITRNELDDAPYIVASDDAHLILASDNRIYVRDMRGKLDRDKVRYSVYRRGEEFRDPETDEILGYEIVYAGEARIDLYGDPATATLL
ncbi:MAG TPA: LysM peptidoglycan-binding domain-containing protein, partial [Gammaproteobacteria bacterium]|nr:LysM peptidoglycan-binding domain-containing protein [Gammaproteobacteria bacterium]